MSYSQGDGGDVERAYDARAEGEHGRLGRDAYHGLEFTVTMHWLGRYLGAGSCVLDAGGGSGRYTVALARLGHRVTLLDLSGGLLAVARREIGGEPAEVRQRVSEVAQGDIRDLSRYGDASFDATLCLGGPLTHLAEAADRRRAVAELVRVTRVGGIVAVSVMGYWGMLRTLLSRVGAGLCEELTEECVGRGDGMCGGMRWHFFRVEELRGLMEEHGVAALTVASCEGVSAGLAEATNGLAALPEQWRRWVELVVETSDEPAVVGLGEHILFVGRVGAHIGHA